MPSTCSVRLLVASAVFFCFILLLVYHFKSDAPIKSPAINHVRREWRETRPNVDPASATFQLFTRQSPFAPQILVLGNETLLENSNFNPDLPVKFFVHGFRAIPEQGYSTIKGWLETEDCNTFSVDWSIVSRGTYDDVAANVVPVVGVTTGAFVDFLIDHGAKIDSFHLVGFSMGAHIVGDAGAAVASGKIPRITGLDPASRGFPLESLDTRLDTTDAHFVDVIHTDIAFLEPTGHADFYPNGGVAPQPGCKVGEGCCNHCRAVDLFAESITSTKGFRSVQCGSYLDFRKGKCANNPVQLMGQPLLPSVRGTYYLYTNAAPPFAQG